MQPAYPISSPQVRLYKVPNLPLITLTRILDGGSL